MGNGADSTLGRSLREAAAASGLDSEMRVDSAYVQDLKAVQRATVALFRKIGLKAQLVEPHKAKHGKLRDATVAGFVEVQEPGGTKLLLPVEASVRGDEQHTTVGLQIETSCPLLDWDPEYKMTLSADVRFRKGLIGEKTTFQFFREETAWKANTLKALAFEAASTTVAG